MHIVVDIEIKTVGSFPGRGIQTDLIHMYELQYTSDIGLVSYGG